MEKIIKAGTKVVFFYHTGYGGMNGYDFFELTSDFTEDHLQGEARQACVQHAESFGIYIDSDEEDDYSGDNIDGWYEIYNPEDHDGYRMTGQTGFNKL